MAVLVAEEDHDVETLQTYTLYEVILARELVSPWQARRKMNDVIAFSKQGLLNPLV